MACAYDGPQLAVCHNPVAPGEMWCEPKPDSSSPATSAAGELVVEFESFTVTGCG